jgi:hypothetical protein
MGMTDVVPGSRLLSADFARPCHGALLVIFLRPVPSGWKVSKNLELNLLVETNKKGKWFFENNLQKGRRATNKTGVHPN